jgi:hypothetical protein
MDMNINILEKGMRVKLQSFAASVLFLLTSSAFAQSITITPDAAEVAKGGTTDVTLTYVAGGATTNLDFTMTYDETVVDETAIVTVCDAAALGIDLLNCSVNTTTNEVKGIGINFSGTEVQGADFAVITFPILVNAASGASTNPFAAGFSASGTVTPFDTTWTLNVSKADQTISPITVSPMLADVGGTATLSATATSGLAVTFASDTLGVCAVAGTSVSYATAGTCTVTATQAGNDSFNPAVPVSTNIAVKGNQVITNFAATPDGGAVGDMSTLSATGGASSMPVVYGTTNASLCTVAGNMVTYLTAGQCFVTANQAGDANYNPATEVQLTLVVTKGEQVITDFAATPAGGAVGETSALTATGGGSGNAVTFGTSTTLVCTVSGSTVTYVGSGTCTLTADQLGNANYNDAVQATLDVFTDRAEQIITGFVADPASGVVDGVTSMLTATSDSGLTVTYTSSTDAVCTVLVDVVTYLTAGTCTVAADQAGDPDYEPAPQVTLDIVVAKADQAITAFTATPSSGEVDGTSTLSATAGMSTSPVVFGSSTPDVCTVAPLSPGASALAVESATVTFIAAGTCTVTADQAGDDNYNDAPQLTLDIATSKADQTIVGFAADPNAGVAGGSSTLSATVESTPTPVPTAVDSGLDATYGSSTPTICTVAGSTVTYIAVGTCTVTADQAGDANYNPAPQVTLDIVVAQGDQTITSFFADPDNGYVDTDADLIATASSGLVVTFASTTSDICTVTDSTVTYIDEGVCMLTADQTGDANYTAAPQVTLMIEVTINDMRPVPTLSQWAQILMFLMMLMIGGMVIRRRTTD